MKYIFVTGGVVSGLGKGHLRRLSGASAEAAGAPGAESKAGSPT
ncbi:MAG: hypothetical protein ACLU9S_11165 [Oscillospiraceae bacterium]